MTTRRKLLLTALAAVLLAAAAIGYAVSRPRPSPRPVAAAAGPVTLATGPGTPAAGPGTRAAGPRILAITDRHLTVAPLGGDSRSISGVECLRAYAAAGTAICLRPKTAWSYEAAVLDEELHERTAFAVPGLPNRARVSASGRMVSWTTFVGGDSYAGSAFSTRTGILDTRTGNRADTLENFTIRRDGRPYRSADVNFWGVTFTADDNRFYATMSTGRKRYLVLGDFAARSVTTIKENVECPSLSPDGTRLAFKQAINADPARGWRLSVLDLSTMRVTETTEPTSVDDQAAWLDDHTLMYTLRTGDGTPTVWSVPADGTGAPHPLLTGAESPAPLK
ncbi:TolB family protein [Actinoplanes solisilvae]|uniref:TolB family protein n=1 Tax=Actinoplanes solisilvae TaxID=2486853 RepID=UPI000FD8E196|nr:PD40 domain-containing protein [Actinoplanes solisilvae]